MSAFISILGFLGDCFRNRSVSAAVVFVATAIGLLGVANAAPERLVCQGSRQERADTGRMLTFATGNIVIGIDDSTKEVTLISGESAILYPGEYTGPVQVTRYDSTEIDFHVLISTPSYSRTQEAMINRVTGEFTAVEKDDSPDDNVTVYKGSCTKAEQKF